MLCQPGVCPSLASETAGARTSDSGSLPSRLCASQSPATAPGTAIDLKPSRFSLLTTPGQPKLPTAASPVNSYISGAAASGPFIGNPTTPPWSPTWKTRYPPPPMPLEPGSTTPTAKQAATAASTALPPISSIWTPALVAWTSLVATMPRVERASVLVSLVIVGVAVVMVSPCAECVSRG